MKIQSSLWQKNFFIMDYGTNSELWFVLTNLKGGIAFQSNSGIMTAIGPKLGSPSLSLSASGTSSAGPSLWNFCIPVVCLRR